MKYKNIIQVIIVSLLFLVGTTSVSAAESKYKTVTLKTFKSSYNATAKANNILIGCKQSGSKYKCTVYIKVNNKKRTATTFENKSNMTNGKNAKIVQSATITCKKNTKCKKASCKYNCTLKARINIDNEKATMDKVTKLSPEKWDDYVINCAGNKIPFRLANYVATIVNLIKVFVPIILILLGMIDFLRAVISSDEKKMTESQRRFIKRCVAAVIVYLVFAIVQFAFGIVSEETGSDTMNCASCFIGNTGCNVQRK